MKKSKIGGAIAAGLILLVTNCEQPVKTITVVKQVECDDPSHEECTDEGETIIEYNDIYETNACKFPQQCVDINIPRRNEIIRTVGEFSRTYEGCIDLDVETHVGITKRAIDSGIMKAWSTRKGGYHYVSDVTEPILPIKVISGKPATIFPCLNSSDLEAGVLAGIEAIKDLYPELADTDLYSEFDLDLGLDSEPELEQGE